MEKVDIKKFRCQAKVLGTIVTVAGAMLMTLYKGNVINFFWTDHIQHLKSSAPEAAAAAAAADKDWLKGSILLIIATFAWASFFILQAVTMRRYTAQLSLTTLVCFIGTLQSIAVTFVVEHRPSVWTIGWDMNLLAAAYAVSVFLSLEFLFFSLYHLVGQYTNIYIYIYNMNIYAGYSVIKHSILCSRAGDGEERPCFRHRFQPSHDDHCGCHGLFHSRREDLPWRVNFHLLPILTLNLSPS